MGEREGRWGGAESEGEMTGGGREGKREERMKGKGEREG